MWCTRQKGFCPFALTTGWLGVRHLIKPLRFFPQTKNGLIFLGCVKSMIANPCGVLGSGGVLVGGSGDDYGEGPDDHRTR